MDEVPMSFDIPTTKTVAEAGTKTIGIKTKGMTGRVSQSS